MKINSITTYRKSAIQKQQQRQDYLSLRQQKGWEIARQAAQILREQFAVQKVVLFGSLLDSQRMRFHSDIDLAVWSLPEKYYYRAVAKLLDLDSEFSIDLKKLPIFLSCQSDLSGTERIFREIAQRIEVSLPT